MLQPTIYIPSPLTRALAALEPPPEAESHKEPCCIGRIALAPSSRNLSAIRAVA